jgi:uncharacterized protein YidB (DUF937 family)
LIVNALGPFPFEGEIMGLLDSIVGMAGQALSSKTADNPLLGSVLGMLQNQEGGLSGLVAQFQEKGLGDIASSWVGKGENMPISADQLQSVLGGDKLGEMASQLGISPDALSGQLSEMLPGVVDKLTPNGAVEGGGGFDASSAISMLQGMFKK